MMVSCSAPAKIILSGEHAVVYGKPGLVCAINLRLKVSLWQSEKEAKNKPAKFLAENVKKYLIKAKIKYADKNFDYKIESDIPSSRGMGSSAALSVAMTAALLKFYSGKEYPKKTINQLAYLGEKYFHKNPSGVDVAASCFGGLIYYRKEFEFLKNTINLNFSIPKNIETNIYLIDSGKPKENTAEMVAFVKKLHDQRPALVEEVLAQIEAVTKNTTVSLVKKDMNFFKKSITDNQVLLQMLGVVSKRVKKLLERLLDFGVGKVTGGGGRRAGSGFILFFVDNKRGLENFLKHRKIKYYKFKQDYQGVIYEN